MSHETEPLPVQPPSQSQEEQPQLSQTSSEEEQLTEMYERIRRRQDEIARDTPKLTSVGDAAQKCLSRIPVMSEAAMAERAQRQVQAQQESISRERQRNLQDFFKVRGKRYADCRLGNFELDSDAHRKAVEILTDYAENVSAKIEDGVNIMFIGPPGTGKDHLMTAICRASILAGQRVTWANGQDLWGSFRDAIGADANEARMIRGYVQCDVLALSDPLPPRGGLSDFQAATLFRIIDGRYSSMRPTWVTLNVANRQEAGERIGHQTIDRLAHGALVIGCSWPSYRQGKQ